MSALVAATLPFTLGSNCISASIRKPPYVDARSSCSRWSLRTVAPYATTGSTRVSPNSIAHIAKALLSSAVSSRRSVVRRMVPRMKQDSRSESTAQTVQCDRRRRASSAAVVSGYTLGNCVCMNSFTGTMASRLLQGALSSGIDNSRMLSAKGKSRDLMSSENRSADKFFDTKYDTTQLSTNQGPSPWLVEPMSSRMTTAILTVWSTPAVSAADPMTANARGSSHERGPTR
mmetsp:Transcript_785/g.2132  ORF Transcript_785/g.2132 Transcript_785/m.2132 type:complete len:231 (-) Transcript_785:1597-2289(-)